MNRPAMLVDIMYPLLSVLEANQSAPMPEVIGWELQLADSTDDATLRESYADRLQEWGCVKRSADVLKEAATIRAGGTVPARRYSPVIGLRYPPGTSNVGTDAAPVYRDNSDLARAVIENMSPGGVLVLDNTRDYLGEYEWDLITAPGWEPVEVTRANP